MTLDPKRAIPQPKRDPLVGNLREVDAERPIQSLMRLQQTYGPIFKIELPGRSLILVSSQELVNELSDEQRFDKKVHATLEEIRAFAGDGLFTAHTDEPNWAIAHRVLMPAFGPLGLRDLFDQMLDIADQMLVRFDRFGEHAVIDVPDSMTRLTLDTIALCAFDYRFNSFYQNEMHPFVGAMVEALKESGARARRPELATRLLLLSGRRYEASIRLLNQVADQLIAERRADPDASKKTDLLARMLTARDPVTGQGLSDENIRYQMITFLIAGHETTSGLLSFALYALLRYPAVLERVRALVDEVLGKDAPRFEQLPKLRYLEQVLMETLRLWPTAPAFGLKARHDTTIGGGYPITTADTAMVLVPMLHRDPKVWGDDVEAFRPERFDRDAEARLPPNSWKPFGNGQRACIGRPFAMQEATLVLAMLLQRFDVIADDPSYELSIKETLTLKPEGFHVRVKRRGPQPFRLHAPVPAAPQKPLEAAPQLLDDGAPRTPLLVLYGSNAGSAQSFAQRLGSEAPAHGFAVEVATMDAWAGRLPKEGAVVVVTASYEGQPPDNARQLVASLDAVKPGELQGVRYAVFGCGNRQWARTYQAIPLRVDARLEAGGATRVFARGEADASGDFFGAFDAWAAGLWGALAAAFGKTQAPVAAPRLTVEVVREGRSQLLRQGDLAAGRLVENRELTTPSALPALPARSKRHLEIELPEGMSYRAGDYLAVLPRNPPGNVERALGRFGFAADSQVIVHKSGASLTTLPTGYPVAVSELLSSYVELSQPATRAQVAQLAEATRCPPDQKALAQLAEPEAYEREVLGKRVSVLELLERFPACELPFAAFLQMLPPLTARQYSISSSPLWNERACTLTVAVLDAPALSGQGRYLGVASHYLAQTAPGTRIQVAVRPSNPRFHPPADPKTPIIMICAGTGLAPFRGFLQERALKKQAGQEVGRALLFFGCDHPDVDYLYRDELSAWEAAGVVEVRPAFTHRPDGEVTYVQHAVWRDRADIAELFRSGATVYLCGDGRRMAPAVRDTLVRAYQEVSGKSQPECEQWADEIEREHGRYVSDVFA